MDAEKTGKLIRELRTEKALTQQELASLLKVSPTAVSKWENGRNLPDISLLESLAGSLDVSLSELILGERTPNHTGEDTAANREDTAEAALKSMILESIVEQKKRKKRITWFIRIVAAFLVLVCAWRFLPHSFAQILPAGAETMQGIRATLIYTSVEQGSLHSDTYEIDLSREEGKWKDLRAILASTKYRPDLRNPWIPFLNGVSAGNDGKTVTLSLSWGVEAEKTCVIMFLAKNLISVNSWDGSKDRFLLYHPEDRSILDELTLYIVKNGEKK